MKTRLLKISLGAVLAIVLTGFSIRPLLIQYQLWRYDRAATAFSQIHRPVVTTGDLFAGIQEQTKILQSLRNLGYLAEYTLPIQHLRGDAEETLQLLTLCCTAYKIPAAALISETSAGVELKVLDQPENRPHWESMVWMYLEDDDARISTDNKDLPDEDMFADEYMKGLFYPEDADAYEIECLQSKLLEITRRWRYENLPPEEAEQKKTADFQEFECWRADFFFENTNTHSPPTLEERRARRAAQATNSPSPQ